MLCFKQFRNYRTNSVRQLRQNAHHFSTCCILQVFQFVVGIKNFCWFDEHGLSSCGFIVDESFEAALVLGRDGNTESSVTDGHLGILFHQTVLFGSIQDFANLSIGTVGNTVDFAFDAAQFVRSIVAQLPFVVQNTVDSVQQVALDGHLFADIPQIGIFFVLLTRTQIDENVRHGDDKAA